MSATLLFDIEYLHTDENGKMKWELLKERSDMFGYGIVRDYFRDNMSDYQHIKNMNKISASKIKAENYYHLVSVIYLSQICEIIKKINKEYKINMLALEDAIGLKELRDEKDELIKKMSGLKWIVHYILNESSISVDDEEVRIIFYMSV